MKLFPAVALALFAAAPAVASASAFSINFETPWSYAEDFGSFYSGGAAANGSNGPNVGVTFTNVFGLSNDASFTYYAGAPSPIGTAFAFTSDPGASSFLNVAAGVSNALSFYYGSPSTVTGAIKAYSGLNGTGTLLGSFDLAANLSTVDGVTAYDAFSLATFAFGGVARSFDLTGSAPGVLFDNIATVPEPATVLMLLAGGAALVGARRRRG